KDADIINVLRLISEETGENIIASDDVRGKVTLKLRNVPAEQALDTMLKTKGFDRVRQNNILRIAPAEAIQKERDLELARKRSQTEVEETLIKMVTVNYATAAEILDQIKPMLTQRGSVQVDARTNTIILQDIASNIDRLVELAKRLDKQTPLVNIQARIVEASTSHLRDLGVQWGGQSQMTSRTGNATGLMFPGDVITSGAADDPARPQFAGLATPTRYAVNLPATLAGAGGGLGFILGSAGGSQLLNLRLTAMETNGTGKIISSPEVSTLDNKTAKVSQGVEIPISVVSAAGTNTRFIPAVLELEVTPHVTNDGTVLLKIHVQKSEPDFTNKGAAGDPTIQKKMADTEVLVRDGDTSVIGGIYTRNATESYSEIPFLSRIPLLGNLFRQHRSQDIRAELLVFITPRIINRDESVVLPGNVSGGTREQL
ncbi:MAG TPA: type IV pilus secretin PilQ, partial [Myxococcota bacterium]|nr:type IV pilus secretin PilQ [Myxococcota bacterium]